MESSIVRYNNVATYVEYLLLNLEIKAYLNEDKRIN